MKPLPKAQQRHMMATVAYHKLGDISRDEPDLCWVLGETDDGTSWVGNWCEGFGFFGVEFPKSTTRPVTAPEKERYERMVVRINSGPVMPVRIIMGTTP